MTTIRDTLQTYDELVKAGFDDKAARAQVYAITKNIEVSLDHVATQQDIKNLEKDVKIFFSYMIGGVVLSMILLPVFLRYVGIA